MLDAVSDVFELHPVKLNLSVQSTPPLVIPASHVNGIIVGEPFAERLDIDIRAVQLAQKGAVVATEKRSISIATCHR
jgi:hypothetical protein